MKFISFILILVFSHNWLIASKPIAIISKFRGKVQHELVSEKNYRKNALLNTNIFSGSKIKTKKSAFSKVVYLDDGSVISIYPNTEIKFQGTIANRRIYKKIDFFSVKKPG